MKLRLKTERKKARMKGEISKKLTEIKTLEIPWMPV